MHQPVVYSEPKNEPKNIELYSQSALSDAEIETAKNSIAQMPELTTAQKTEKANAYADLFVASGDLPSALRGLALMFSNMADSLRY